MKIKGIVLQYINGEYVLYVDDRLICENNDMDKIVNAYKEYTKTYFPNETLLKSEVW